MVVRYARELRGHDRVCACTRGWVGAVGGAWDAIGLRCYLYDEAAETEGVLELYRGCVRPVQDAVMPQASLRIYTSDHAGWGEGCGRSCGVPVPDSPLLAHTSDHAGGSSVRVEDVQDEDLLLLLLRKLLVQLDDPMDRVVISELGKLSICLGQEGLQLLDACLEGVDLRHAVVVAERS